MSFDAMSLAMRLDIRPSGTKFVLVALANCADERGLCWPSVDHLAQVTAQDRKTIMLALKRLESDRWISDTNERRGRTGQVKVLRLNLVMMADPPMFHGDRKSTENGLLADAVNSAENGLLAFANSTESGTVAALNSTENGTLAPRAGDANGTENGMLAAGKGTESGTVGDGNSTVFSGKGSQKRDTEPVIEPEAGGSAGADACVPTPARTREAQLVLLSTFDRQNIAPYLADLPAGIELELFADFVKHRRVLQRALSISSWKQLLALFANYVEQGIDLNQSLRETMALGLSLPVRPNSRGSPAKGRPRVNADFSAAQYQATPADELPPELRNAG